MARPRFDLPYEIVDLSSDGEDDVLSGDELEFFDAQSERQGAVEDMPAMDGLFDELNTRYNPVYDAVDEIIDLTEIPDIDVPPSDDPMWIAWQDAQPSNAGEELHIITEAECLQMVLDVLPDISTDHVLNLIREKTADLTRTAAQCENIITQLLDGEAYPKEADEARNKKRKRDDEDDWKEFEKAERDPRIANYASDAVELLRDEFLSVPVRHITNVVSDQKTLFKAYVILEEQVRNYGHIAKYFKNISKSRNKRGIETFLIEQGSQLPKELQAAKKKIEGDMWKRRKAEDAERAEKQNLKQAQKNNEMGECACCFDDVPLNRMISCNGDTSHFYCLECPKRQVETQMGQSKCRPKCFGVDNCGGAFTRAQLRQVLGDTTFERLEHMQQQQDLAAAGLDFLSECPFCDFKMECPPVEVDKEFRCESKKCGKTSCRLCEKETHIPLTCKEADKEGQLTLRHIVEEAMSAALIRQCNSCKHPFVKEYGCNKMTCSHCSNVQCYVCSKNVTNYEHFGDVGRGRCPLHENVEDRHEQEVKQAADEAMAKVRADNPHLSDADLMIKVSDRVKQAEDARKGKAQAQVQAFPFHMVNDQLQQRVAPYALPVHHRAGPMYPPVAQYVPPHAVAPAPPFLHLHPPYHGMQPPPYQQQIPLPPHPPAAFEAVLQHLPRHRFVGHQDGAHNAPVPPNIAPRLQAPLPAPPPPVPAPRLPHFAPLDANNLNQRLDQLQQQQHELAQAGVARRLRLLRLQQENLVQQRELLEEVPHEQRLQRMNEQLRDLEQLRAAHDAAHDARTRQVPREARRRPR